MRTFSSLALTASGPLALALGLYLFAPAAIETEGMDGAGETREVMSEPEAEGAVARQTGRPDPGGDTADDSPSSGESTVGVDGTAPPGELRRLPPREPLSQIAAPAEAPDPVRLRLLPRPVALDTARLAVGEGIVVLPGVEGLSSSERCGQSGAQWLCGARARTAFRTYLRGRSVECEAPENFGRREETVTSACTLAGEDVAQWVVANGWARAEAGGPYGEAEAQARRARLGIWGEPPPSLTPRP
ncbi:thermonuclease family protein [Fulvimarina endophytica]|uniref:Thermonuclease family protein n=1 Tax=Fulvimarina endophytica TaxID=2293836 RepID=A0A371X7E8_9HYPH|nr:thermonuclease family protein [Fulvimarina endophytica]RFC65111.1 thermonuclease family protein [Fulvimarina endophytica]